MSALLIITLTSFIAQAVPASPDIVTYTQPDGSIIEFRHIGDENHHRMIAISDGKELAFDSDGFLRPIESLPSPCAVDDTPFKDKYLMSGSHFPHKGSPRALVILVIFPDKFFSMEQPGDYYHRMLNEENFSLDDATGSARDFFINNSQGVFTPQFDVYGPVLMSKPSKYYGENDRYGYDLHPEEVVVEALTKLDSTVDFSLYDTDNDDVIDNVYVFYAGIGEQDSYQASAIWPHSANILDFDIEEKEFYFDGKLLNHYAMSNEINSKSMKPDGMGTFVHEFSHVLGLPDLYATAYTSSFTPGRYSTLDRAPYNNLGRTPANYSLFERLSLDWASPEIISTSGVYTLYPIEESN
ncbi:MAG: M6 family metalloprotease domain-containing protein, partial [Muribaculaceae bacterium]|nr:M6 family metalloprotease domain-containing protein [Muribaculaceae bacterium]